MISFDLKCAGGHVFEIWFRSSTDYEAQRAAHQIMCPICGEQHVEKAVMAPAVAAKGSQRRTPSLPMDPSPFMAGANGPEQAEHIRALMHALAEAQAQALKESQWVGDRFADQARAMYYGEADNVAIHGTANLAEARAMLEEGLPVAPLLVPMVPPDRAN
jgi:hypothetical protein